MRPLQSIAMGLVIIALSAPIGGYDALPDPVGWLLVLFGIVGLPADLPKRGSLLGVAAIAGAVAVPLWFPEITTALYDTHPSLGWAANLAQLGFAALLCHCLAGRATESGDVKASRWLRLAEAGFVGFALLPILVFGAGVTSLEIASYVGATVGLIMLIWMLFAYSSRPWTGLRNQPRAEPPAA